MSSRQETAEEQWNRLMAGEQPSQMMSVPASRQVQTPQQRKDDERTRLVREMTDEAAEERLAKVARLKQARLDKEASDKAQAALGTSKAQRRSPSAS